MKWALGGPHAMVVDGMQFPDTEEEEPPATKEARAHGELPRVDLEEETAAVSEEYEFQHQASPPPPPAPTPASCPTLLLPHRASTHSVRCQLHIRCAQEHALLVEIHKYLLLMTYIRTTQKLRHQCLQLSS